MTKKTKSKSPAHVVFKNGDYLVVAPEDPANKKYLLVKTTDVYGSTIEGWNESARKGLNTEKVTVKVNNVVTSLGPNPPAGKVYGLDLTNRFRKNLEHPFWGNILVYTSLESSEIKLIKNSLDRTAKKIEKMGLEPFTDFIDTHIVAKQGKWAGMYNHSRDQEKTRSYIQYAPECAALNADMMDYIVYHEFGHCVRYNGILGKKVRLKWLLEYNRSIQPFEISLTQLKRVLKYLESYVDEEVSLAHVFRDFISEDEDNKPVVRGIMRWFQEVHHLAPKELGIIWDGKDFKTFSELWPTKAIDSSSLAPVLTEYATKNVEELFAECFAFYSQGKKMPERLRSLTENSISYAKASTKGS